MSLLRPRYLLPVLAVLVLGAWLAWSRLFSVPSTQGLLTAEVVAQDIQRTVVATGTLQAFNQVSVGAQVSGRIESLKVDFGDEVKKGDLIAEIDSLTQQNDLKNARAALANVKAQRAAKQASRKQAQLAFERQRSMSAQNASSREDYETAEASLAMVKAEIEALDAQIEQAQLQVSSAELNLGYTKITAPIDGTVVGVVVKEGQTVNSAQSAPTLVKLAQLDKMTVKAEISEADVVHVQAGLPVYFTTLGEPGKYHEATLRAIEPAPDSINSESDSSSTTSTDTAIYYNGVFDVPNEDGRLRISMTAEVNIVLDQAKGAPSIPVAALGSANRDGSYTVQVLRGDGRSEPRKIRTGIEDSLYVQVLDGLQLGEKIVLGDAAQGSSTQMRRGPGMRF
ncbi:efflux RND transporter periplasmic adaptor subunit [Stutzerimonas kirkiae]|uniref:Efflux transporter periplasmic adaptor subunit n=1 Tax=Stutzerimonas kirkiae TaxID=2211392 RepID=A0A4Q9RBM7_9GAMM|nr:efflux RND transporter periplasmic adaptor subunit [Stutzerimonas kirkiae]TBU98314.1 efflux transporter periplasmic adaptor subunit [Stutzerimonas kirkiae]TBV01949.1 efflux transporter periplasmic adaptor subunit [Stutzerimonas kirkiae]TBV06962.1 efflux transporter periplasmic adaptor subunit [Stutzerimonas kirkiae]TBV16231.1 efflux transporter periplasmic adaptor subunit [Stutzerimonas kirkiae]